MTPKKASRLPPAAPTRTEMRQGPFEPATRRQITALVSGLSQLYPDADCELDWQTPLDLLVATILSAQSTDGRVNVVTKSLFKKYKTAADYADAQPDVFEREIQSTGFFRQKTKNVLATARQLVEEHAGRVPKSLTDLVELPGVARKTANVVLGTAFQIPSGFVVDTHVSRLAFRLGLSPHSDAVKIERDLMQQFPADRWIFLGHALIWHGRRVCMARRPKCSACAIQKACPRNGLGETDESETDP